MTQNFGSICDSNPRPSELNALANKPLGFLDARVEDELFKHCLVASVNCYSLKAS